MKLHVLCCAAALCLVALAPRTVDAQNRRRVQVPQNRGVNPLHEQTKIQAEQAQQKGDYSKAIQLTTTVLRFNSRDDVALYIRASARVEMGIAGGDANQVRAGIADARQAIQFQKKTNFNYYLPYLYGMTNLAGIENKQSHAEVCIKVADQVISRAADKPDDKANLLYQRAMAHVFLKKFDSAASDYAEAVRLNPKHLGAYIGLADAYGAAGKHQESLASFAKAEQAFPNNPLIYNNRGMILQRQKKYTEAVADFTRAIELNPGYFVAYTNRGFTMLEQGHAEVAENDFSASLRVKREQPMVHSLRGTSRLAQGKVNQAIDDYRRVVALDGRNPVAHADLGFAQFFENDYSSAVNSFGQSVALSSQLRYVDPWRVLAMVLSGKTDEAKRQFQIVQQKQAQERSWFDHLVVYVLGGIPESELLKQVSQADGQLRTSQLCEAHFFIGQLKAKSGQSKEADAHFQKALETKARHLSAFRGAQFALRRFVTTE